MTTKLKSSYYQSVPWGTRFVVFLLSDMYFSLITVQPAEFTRLR